MAAAETTGDPAVVLRAGAGLGVEPAALDAEAAGLVRAGDGRLQFRHPLVRSAAYQTATLAARQAAHRALAGVLTGEDSADQRAWHLAAATVGPDEQVAAELERSADRARRRAGTPRPPPPWSGRPGSAATTTSGDAGWPRPPTRPGWPARPAGPPPCWSGPGRWPPISRTQATVAHLRGSIEASRGIALEAAAMLVAGSELAAPVDPSQALQMLVEASEIASYAGDVTPTAELGRRAAALPVTDKVGEFLSDLLQGMGRVAEGDGQGGAPPLRRAIALAATMEQPRLLLWAGVAAFFVGESGTGTGLYARAVARARQEGAVGLLPQALEYLAPVELAAGRLEAAAASAGEGLRLARETGNDTSACRHLATLAHVAALRGDEDACRGHAAEALDRAAARGLGLPATLAGYALALLDLGLGRPAEALARLQRLLAAAPGAGSPFFAAYTVPDLVEAAVRDGRPEVAAAPGRLRAARHPGRHPGAAGPARPLPRPAGPRRGGAGPLRGGAGPARRPRVPVRPGPDRAGLRGGAAPGPAAARPAPTSAAPSRPSSGWGRPPGPSGPPPSCGPPARPPAAATPARCASSPPRSCRSSAWWGRAGPTARSAPSCSSAAAPSTTTCATCS